MGEDILNTVAFAGYIMNSQRMNGGHSFYCVAEQPPSSGFLPPSLPKFTLISCLLGSCQQAWDKGWVSIDEAGQCQQEYKGSVFFKQYFFNPKFPI